MTYPNGTDARYVPGSWVGIAGTRTWLLADLDPADPVVTRCWELIQADAVVDAVLDALAGSQVRPALNFAIMRLDGSAAEVAVHGAAWADVHAADPHPADARRPAANGASREVRAAPGAFGAVTVDKPAVVRLHAAGTDGAEAVAAAYSLGLGVVTAAEIMIRPGRSGRPSPAASSMDTGRPSGLPGQFDTLFGATSRPAPEPDPAAQIPAEWLHGMRRPAAFPASDHERPPPPPAPTPPASTPPASTPSAPTPSAPSAWPTLPPEYTSVPSDDGSYRSPFEGPFAGNYRPEPRASAPPVGGGRVIEDVSWAMIVDEPGSADPYVYPVPAPPATHPPADPPTPAAGDIDPELLKTTMRPSGPPVASGPVVGAVRCGAGHLNPPAARNCRVCADPVAPQSPQPVPRPPLGVLRLSTGEVVTLDRGVILGRAPGAPRGLGPDEPHRIQVPSPDSTISRKHVEVVLDGWLVSVIDLESTNGTAVTPTGGVSEALPRGGRMVIDDGYVVNLDATTWFQFEVTPS